MEIDALAYANSEVNEAYIVEVKSHAREEALDQLTREMRKVSIGKCEKWRFFFKTNGRQVGDSQIKFDSIKRQGGFSRWLCEGMGALIGACMVAPILIAA